MCICGNNKKYNECCGAIIHDNCIAKTPQELMRSRYTAYVEANTDYLYYSSTKESRHPEDAKLIKEFTQSIQWLKLDILNTYQNIVEFKAYYRDNSGIHLLHEKSCFIKENGVWKYKEGELYTSKVERNEPCPCGSGKKFKKCCMS